jgi:hypothetical protein
MAFSVHEERAPSIAPELISGDATGNPVHCFGSRHFFSAPASSFWENRCQPQMFPNGMDMGDLQPLAVDVTTAVLAPHVQRV